MLFRTNLHLHRTRPSILRAMARRPTFQAKTLQRASAAAQSTSVSNLSAFSNSLGQIIPRNPPYRQTGTVRPERAETLTVCVSAIGKPSPASHVCLSDKAEGQPGFGADRSPLNGLARFRDAEPSAEPVSHSGSVLTAARMDFGEVSRAEPRPPRITKRRLGGSLLATRSSQAR